MDTGMVQSHMQLSAVELESRTIAARLRRPDVRRSYIIPILAKTITIIRLLEQSDEPMNLDQIVKKTGISRTTAYRILRTLSAYGYLPAGTHGIYTFRNVLEERAL